MNYFHCLHKFMATSKKRKKGERASPACFFLLLTSIIPLSHSHRLAAFIRFLHHTVPPPFLILYLEDKPHFIPTQQQSQKNTVALRHCGWMWSDDQPQYGLSWVFFFTSSCWEFMEAGYMWRYRVWKRSKSPKWGLINTCFLLLRRVLGRVGTSTEVMTKTMFCNWEGRLGLFIAHDDGWDKYKHRSKHFYLRFVLFVHFCTRCGSKREGILPHNAFFFIVYVLFITT